MVSMTGFGRAQGVAQGRQVVVEVRSVNHRALDVKVRGRNLPAAVEFEIIRAVRAAVSRGSVQISLEDTGDAGGEPTGGLPLAVSSDRIREAYQALEQLRAALGIERPVDLPTIASFLRLDRDRPGDPPALAWTELEPLVDRALAGLQAARSQEGAALAAELDSRSRHLDQIAVQLEERTRGIPARAQQRLQERLEISLRAAAGGPALDPARLAQEAALLADRLDVSEELARLGAHRQRLRELLTAPGGRDGIGRTLEFLLQELGRELNTLGSKSQDAEVSALVIAGKAELEKIREQAQNIE
jgi:uncharacterized protein (TIGR00255 family)